jgi:hypothetical protein
MTTPNPIVFTFSYADFILAYPGFANATTFPEATLQGYWDMAINYISPSNYGWLSGNARLQALNLLTAHIAQLFVTIQAGQVPGLMQTATIDKVTVGLTPPPLKSQFQWWLSLTGYGQQLLAMLQIFSVGGFYFGSLPERAAFRCVGGIFPPGGGGWV